MGIDAGQLGHSLVATTAYSLLGITMFAVSFLVISKIVPFSIRKEIEEDQNVALALLISAVILGLSLIIASAIGG
jgi:putative membrane protein